VSKYKTFVSFIGPMRSGHSLVASILNAHPNIQISLEVNPLKRFVAKDDVNHVFSDIQRYCKRDTEREMGGYKYNLKVRNKDVQIIGDSITGHKYLHLLKSRGLKNYMEYIGIPMVFIWVLRNPFDLIHSSFLINRKPMPKNVKFFKQSMDISRDICENNYRSTYILPIEDFITNTKPELKKLTDFLGVKCSKQYLNLCDKFVFDEPHRVFNPYYWEGKEITKVNRFIKKLPELERYKDEIF